VTKPVGQGEGKKFKGKNGRPFSERKISERKQQKREAMNSLQAGTLGFNKENFKRESGVLRMSGGIAKLAIRCGEKERTPVTRERSPRVWVGDFSRNAGQEKGEPGGG